MYVNEILDPTMMPQPASAATQLDKSQDISDLRNHLQILGAHAAVFGIHVLLEGFGNQVRQSIGAVFVYLRSRLANGRIPLLLHLLEPVIS